MSGFGKVAVLFGGTSAEREVSLNSGSRVLAALQGQGIDAHPFDPAVQPLDALKGYDRAFIALHGRHGEDGTIQGALEVMHIPYTGSGVLASALAMDKFRTKLMWQAAGLPVPEYALLNADSDFAEIEEQLGLPLFVKPAREGSSVGAAKVTRAADLRAAYEAAVKHDPLVIAEQFIEGEELTAAFLGSQALPLVRIVAPGGNYDWQNKYFSDETQYFCPSGLPESAEETIQDLVLEAAQLLDCRGWGRADLILDAAGKPWLLEMNTSPGMTGHSLVPMSARVAGLDFTTLCLRILEGARLG